MNASSSGPRTSFLPREHGAYGMLGFPLIAALSSGRPTWAALLLMLASVAAFLAHEPWLVILGERGERRRNAFAPSAMRRVAIVTALGLVAFVGGFWAAPVEVRLWLIAPLVLGGISAGLAFAGKEKTTLGETIVAIALAAWALPIALAAGVGFEGALALFAVYAAGYALLTVTMRAVIAFRKHRFALRRVSLVGAPVVAGAGFAASTGTPSGAWIASALTVFCAVSAGLAISPPHPRHLKRIGWSVIGASVLSTVLVIVGVRGC